MPSSIDHVDMSSFTGRTVLLQGPHLAQFLYCIYGGTLSFLAINHLRQYEATAKKAAEWSKEAEKQLWKTRTTQASGALAVCSSTVFPYTTIDPSCPDLASDPRLLSRLLQSRIRARCSPQANAHAHIPCTARPGAWREGSY
jgi:hypothetical protein